MTDEHSVRELLLLAQNHIPLSQITLRGDIEGWLASHPASSDLRAQNADAYGYAKRFLEAFVAEHFPPNPDWKPLPDLMGVLTQIDNASTIASDLCAQNAELVAALKEARQRLAKGRALWNGPCHECDAVLAAALKDKP
jgi:hypothetical protein